MYVAATTPLLSSISIIYTAVAPIWFTNDTSTPVWVTLLVTGVGHGIKPGTTFDWLAVQVSTPSVTLNSTRTFISPCVFKVDTLKLRPLALFCKVETLKVCVKLAPKLSVTVILLNPAESLNELGILEFIKLKFMLSIIPLELVPVLVVYAKVIPSHPLGQQFVWTFESALYRSSITTQAFCNDCAIVLGEAFHPVIEP